MYMVHICSVNFNVKNDVILLINRIKQTHVYILAKCCAISGEP